MASRDIELLSPIMQEKYWLFDAGMKKAGLTYIVTCTARSIIEQMALFVQGRLELLNVNRFRFIAGMPNLQESQNNIVTWTLASRHVTNMFDEKLNNNYAEAFDFALTDKELPHWILKADINKNSINDYAEAGIIAESVGLVWGGRWKKPDPCHIQDDDT